jgi:DNA-binding NarL/FixJ family response regulator
MRGVERTNETMADHPVVRDGLRMTIERSGKDIVVVGEASDGMEVLKMAKAKPADVFILDIMMPNMNGIETTRELAKRVPAAKAIILSLHDTKALVEEALAAGARGYLTKEMATRHVVDAISEVHAGHYYLSPSISHFIVEDVLKGKKYAQKARRALALAGKERKVLQLIAEGHSNKEIAGMLDLSVNTIHAYRNHLAAKLNIHKQTDLVHYAIKAGIAKL